MAPPLRRFTLLALLLASPALADDSVWAVEKANRWYAAQPWLTGADFIPSSAINQLEMWQAATFDPATIDRELGWAQGIGFNTARVFLHHLAWKADPEGFLNRVDQFLTIAQSHHIRPLFVFFDDCWLPDPKIGPQPAPRPGVHNSGWVQDPGWPASRESANFPELQAYVTAVLGRFGHDPRVLLWDLYNEPGNSNKGDDSLPLLEAVFSWARAAGPDQPISAGIWSGSTTALTAFQGTHSDVITYHNYEPPEDHLKEIRLLRVTGRPLICTEYMARPRNSRFANELPMLKHERVAAINWGFVSGKTNTIYAWNHPIPDGSQPDEWFHDIFSKDGTAYRQDEVNLIRRLNGVSP